MHLFGCHGLVAWCVWGGGVRIAWDGMMVKGEAWGVVRWCVACGCAAHDVHATIGHCRVYVKAWSCRVAYCVKVDAAWAGQR